jgi:hypothetical protein
MNQPKIISATDSAPITLTISTRAHLKTFLERVNPARGRLMFALDATASRQPTWDSAAALTSEMFATVAAIGGLDLQLVYYCGDQCVAGRWLSDARALSASMRSVMCQAGYTQIGRVLGHAQKENARERVNALVLVSDACEEDPESLYTAARELGELPLFLFQEGNDQRVGRIYAELAAITKGAFCKFDSGAARRLADLLKAVAAFAAGGVKALAAQNSEAAKLLLTQVKK